MPQPEAGPVISQKTRMKERQCNTLSGCLTKERSVRQIHLRGRARGLSHEESKAKAWRCYYALKGFNDNLNGTRNKIKIKGYKDLTRNTLMR